MDINELDWTNIEGNPIKLEDYTFDYDEYWGEDKDDFWAISICLNEPKRFEGNEINIKDFNNIYIDFLKLNFSEEKYNLLKEEFKTEGEAKNAFEKFITLK